MTERAAPREERSASNAPLPTTLHTPSNPEPQDMRDDEGNDAQFTARTLPSHRFRHLRRLGHGLHNVVAERQP